MNMVIKLLLVVCLCGALLGVFQDDALAVPGVTQDATSAQPQEEQPAGRPQVTTPPPNTRTPTPPRKEAPSSIIEDIQTHRQASLPFIRSHADWVDLKLETVNYDADVLAVVNGVPITQQLYRNYLIAFMGGLEVNQYLTAILSRIGKKARIENGTGVESDFQVTEERIKQEIESQIKVQQQQKKAPEDLTYEKFKESVDGAFGWERYKALTEATILFSKIYLPDVVPNLKTGPEEEKPAAGEGEEEVEKELDPNLPVAKNSEGKDVNIYIPMITWEALSQREQDLQMRDYLNQIYENGQMVGDLLMPQFSRMVKDALLRSKDVEYFYTGNLNPDIYLRIDQEEVTVDDIYNMVKDRITDEEKRMALREVILIHAMDKALGEAGSLLDDEAFAEVFAAHEALYSGSMFPLEFMIQLYGYFNMERYKNIYRRRAGFEKMIADDLNNEEVLKGFYEGAARLFYEQGTAKVQVIFFGIRDKDNQTVLENGFDLAQAKMDEVVKALDSGEDFMAVAKRFEEKGSSFATSDFRPMNRRDLRVTLGESAKSSLIAGYSLTDYIFYCGTPGEMVGPIVKRWSEFGNPFYKGIFLVKIIEYRKSQPLSPIDQRIDMVKIDYADLRFNDWAQEALKASKVELTTH